MPELCTPVLRSLSKDWGVGGWGLFPTNSFFFLWRMPDVSFSSTYTVLLLFFLALMTTTQQSSMRMHPSRRFWFQSGSIWKLMGRNSEMRLHGTWMVCRKEGFPRLERYSWHSSPNMKREQAWAPCTQSFKALPLGGLWSALMSCSRCPATSMGPSRSWMHVIWRA